MGKSWFGTIEGVKCYEENEGILEKNHFGPWDAQIFEVAPALIVPRFLGCALLLFTR